MLKITILGAGAIGQTIGKILVSPSRQVKFWDRKPTKNQKALEKTVPKSDFIFLCFPSSGIAETTKLISPYLTKKTIIISLAKGISQNHLKTVDEILEKTCLKTNPSPSWLAHF